MQLLGIVIGQLGCITLLLGSIDSGLSLTHLSLIGLVINNKKYLTGTNGLSFLHINLGKEALSFRTDFHILHTLDRGGIGGLHICLRRTYRHNWILVVAKRRTTTAATTRNKRCSNGCNRYDFLHFHTSINIIRIIYFLHENLNTSFSFQDAKVAKKILFYIIDIGFYSNFNKV